MANETLVAAGRVIFRCSRCHGAGLEPGSYTEPYEVCAKCGGDGEEPSMRELNKKAREENERQ